MKSTGNSAPSLPEELATLSLAMQRFFLLSLTRDLDRASVSFSQFFLLAYLDQTRHLTMSKIAKQMGHTTAAATGLVDRLEGLGYVTREHSREDRRKVFCAITKKGSQLVQRVKDDLAAHLAELSTALSPEEQSAWIEIYRKLVQVYRLKHEA